MPQPTDFHIRLGWSGWLALILALGLILTLATAVAVLLLGVFIILLPVMLVGAVLFYLFPGLRYRRQDQAREPDILEGEYRVVDPTRRELDPPPSERI
jgi:predicted lipid-binding transport protein (Tim44 family)